MSKRHPSGLPHDLHAVVKETLHQEGVVNVPAIAVEIHRRQGRNGPGLKDLEGQVLAAAMAMNAIIVFDRPDSDSEQEKP